ncbi:hypothetical protein OAJ56_01750 [Flavobacteriales bacterium]|nr:hypothetical protein [Flavobacteriales bacterium]
MDTLETAFEIQVTKDTTFLKYIVTEYSNLGKVNWIKKEGGVLMNASPLTFDPVKKRELVIKKIKQVEPGYNPPDIKLPTKNYLAMIIGFIIFAGFGYLCYWAVSSFLDIF